MRRNQILLVVVIVVCCSIMAYINTAAYYTGQHTFDDEVALNKQRAVWLKQALASRGSDTKPLVTESTVGNPAGAKVRITLGYTADEYVACHTGETDKYLTRLQAWAKEHKSVSVQIVCIDIPPAQRSNLADAAVPLGLTVNGNLAPGCSGNLEPGALEYGAIAGALLDTQAALAGSQTTAPSNRHGA